MLPVLSLLLPHFAAQKNMGWCGFDLLHHLGSFRNHTEAAKECLSLSLRGLSSCQTCTMTVYSFFQWKTSLRILKCVIMKGSQNQHDVVELANLTSRLALAASAVESGGTANWNFSGPILASPYNMLTCQLAWLPHSKNAAGLKHVSKHLCVVSCCAGVLQLQKTK